MPEECRSPRPDARARLTVAAEVYGLGVGPAAWRRGPRTNEAVLEAIEEAAAHLDTAGADYLVVADSLTSRFAPDIDSVRPDALLVASGLVTRTRQLGLIPAIGLPATEPFHVSRAVATLDILSGGRGGWHPVAPEDDPLVDRSRPGAEPGGPSVNNDRYAEHIAVTRALATSWEPDAILWDTRAGRFLDAARIHTLEPLGEHFPVIGPSPTPRPPRGGLYTVVDATAQEVSLAARWADEAIVRAESPAEAAAVATALRRSLNEHDARHHESSTRPGQGPRRFRERSGRPERDAPPWTANPPGRRRDIPLRIAVRPYLADTAGQARELQVADCVLPAATRAIPVVGTAGEIVAQLERLAADLATPRILLSLPDTRGAAQLWHRLAAAGLPTGRIPA
ncbi:LLM class flavin-dependent oxidoreductase [Nocardia speluncae]|uniref:LLM class flavin-dependent oxidoreductase n=1 Tax=Nocardia speluncae TaxID=419477 RepID=A0A846XDR0_9NOCA|nr:LLM class flavin-dependent oxidoreductase [Nocardia speluncae]NKY33515.1 LLM class flavin-dependent oxidoreductase [Nocardia speluncae]